VARNTEVNIADVRLTDDVNPTEWQANMRLIAAAPDLLAAGQAVLASLDAGTLMQQRGGVVRDVAAVSRLRAAIAKAEQP